MRKKETRELSSVSFIGTLNWSPVPKGSILMTSLHPKSPTSQYHSTRVWDFKMWILGRHKHSAHSTYEACLDLQAQAWVSSRTIKQLVFTSSGHWPHAIYLPLHQWECGPCMTGLTLSAGPSAQCHCQGHSRHTVPPLWMKDKHLWSCWQHKISSAFKPQSFPSTSIYQAPARSQSLF